MSEKISYRLGPNICNWEWGEQLINLNQTKNDTEDRISGWRPLSQVDFIYSQS